jgi:hypothetical protein
MENTWDDGVMSTPWPYGTGTPNLAGAFQSLAYPLAEGPVGCYPQTYNDLIDYQIDWSNELSTGDSITSSTWIAEAGTTGPSNQNTTSPAALTLSNSSFTSSTSTIWVSGGTACFSYRIINTITTSGGRQFNGSLNFRIVELP